MNSSFVVHYLLKNFHATTNGTFIFKNFFKHNNKGFFMDFHGIKNRGVIKGTQVYFMNFHLIYDKFMNVHGKPPNHEQLFAGDIMPVSVPWSKVKGT